MQRNTHPIRSMRPYDLAWVEPRRVHKDCHFSWEGNRYSLPWRCGSTSVLVRRFPDGRLEVERGGEVIAHHRERTGKGQTITLHEHVAGLWERTVGRPAATLALSSPVLGTAGPFPHLDVEQRPLTTYQQFLEVRP